MPLILQNIHFSYLLNIQSLEETIFEHIKTHELQKLNKDDTDELDQGLEESYILSESHPNV